MLQKISAKVVTLHAMIELERHIEILLLDCDCVIVPGFGGFVAHHRDARFDEADNMFLPPLRTLGFNPKLNMNDSLLVQSYVEAYDISYPEALARIETEVDELKRNINKDGYYEFENLGLVSLNSQGGYLFEPCESGILTPELYGLAGVELLTVQNSSEETQQSSSQPSEREQHYATVGFDGRQDDNNSDSGRTLSVVNDDEDGTERTIKIKVSVLRNAVAVACAIVAFFVIATPIKTDMNSGTSLSSFQGSAFYNLLQQGESKQATIGKQATPQYKSKVAEPKNVTPKAEKQQMEELADNAASPSPKTIVEVKTTDDKEKDVYSIVLACRITKSNAEEYVQKLRAQGYSDARVLSEKPVKVVCGAYSSEKEALGDLSKMRQKAEFKDCWIFHEK